MFTINRKTKPQIIALYHAEAHNTEAPSAEAIKSLSSVCSMLIIIPELSPYRFYWDYLDLVLHHIEVGEWLIEPALYASRIDRKTIQPLSKSMVRCKAANYSRQTQSLVRRHGGSSKALIMQWLNNEQGFHNMLLAAYVMSQLHDMMTLPKTQTAVA